MKRTVINRVALAGATFVVQPGPGIAGAFDLSACLVKTEEEVEEVRWGEPPIESVDFVRRKWPTLTVQSSYVRTQVPLFVPGKVTGFTAGIKFESCEVVAVHAMADRNGEPGCKRTYTFTTDTDFVLREMTVSLAFQKLRKTGTAGELGTYAFDLPEWLNRWLSEPPRQLFSITTPTDHVHADQPQLVAKAK